MSSLTNRLREFLFAPQCSIWLTILRTGLGLQVFCYGISLRADWIELLGRENQGLIRRDLTEAMLSTESPFIPRVGWLMDIGIHLGLSERTVLWLIWLMLMLAALLVAVGLFCRTSSVVLWLLYVCTAKSAELLSYGVDNFTIIGLFYLAIAPLPDSASLDARWRGKLPRSAILHGLHVRVLQFHMCIIYFFGGISKCAGHGWWNGVSLWRALTRAPFNLVPPEILIRLAFVLPLLGILVCVMEATYPIFIWLRKTRLVWFVGVVGMHVAIGLMMGMYLFASIMIILNVAAFGPELLRLRNRKGTAQAGPTCSRRVASAGHRRSPSKHLLHLPHRLGTRNFYKYFAMPGSVFRRNRQMDIPLPDQTEIQEVKHEKASRSIDGPETSWEKTRIIENPDTTLSIIVLFLACMALAALAHAFV